MNTPGFSNVNRLLELVKRPQTAKRKPSNFALWWAWVFYNAVALLFDFIAATTVYAMMGKIAYAVLTFVAGFLPLLMHEFLFTRAFASGLQKTLAIIGAGLSVVTILIVGILAALVNLFGFVALNSTALEIGMIVTLVLVSGAHGLISAIYFYVDEGIRANQVRTESVAYHERRIEDIQRAKEILALADQGVKQEDEIAAQFGGVEVLNEILGQLRGNHSAGALTDNKGQAQDDEQENAGEWPVWLEGWREGRRGLNTAKSEPVTLQSRAAALPPLPPEGQAKG